MLSANAPIIRAVTAADFAVQALSPFWVSSALHLHV
jgi:hypothetical protein